MQYHIKNNSCARMLMMMAALLMFAVFFLFFGNGSSSDPSLYNWIISTCGGFPREALLCLSGLAVYFIASKKFRHEVLLGRIPLAWGMSLIALAVGVAVWAFLHGYPALTYLSAIVLGFGIITAFYGRGADVFPLILLLGLFALPISPLEPLGPFLQLATSHVVRLLASMLGLDFTSHGTELVFNGFGFRIAEACSGTRSMELGLKFAIFICIVYPMGWTGRLLFIGLSVLVGAFSNLVRLAVVFWFGVWKGSEFAMGMGHEVVGPALGVSILLAYFFLTASFLAKRFSKRKKACCERRMDRHAPLLLVFTAACLCWGAVVCMAGTGADSPFEGAAFKRIHELDEMGNWKRVNGFFCDSTECLFSFTAGDAEHIDNDGRCPICKAVMIRDAAVFNLKSNEEEQLDVFRTRYRNMKSGREVALDIVRGGRPGLSLCSPVWYLRSIGASVDRSSRAMLDAAGSQIKIYRIEFGEDRGDGQGCTFSGIYWHVFEDRVSDRRFHLKSAFQRFGEDEWVCLAYCERHEGSDAELEDFIHQFLEQSLPSLSAKTEETRPR